MRVFIPQMSSLTILTMLLVLAMNSSLLFAADYPFSQNETVFPPQKKEACHGRICISSRDNQDVPDMFEKKDKFDHRKRTYPRSSFDYDHTDTTSRIRLGVDF